jgi:hypothetical protein
MPGMDRLLSFITRLTHIYVEYTYVDGVVNGGLVTKRGEEDFIKKSTLLKITSLEAPAHERRRRRVARRRATRHR